jgi:mRNA interferase MazF
MAILHPLPVGTIVRCDYSRGGFQPPEMVKPRPAIIISPRLPHRDNLCAVVPISGTYVGRDLPYVVRLEFDPPLPEPFSYSVAWAKCDMLATVSFARLDMFRTPRDQAGKRKFLRPQLKADDFQRVKIAILCGLGWPS